MYSRPVSTYVQQIAEHFVALAEDRSASAVKKLTEALEVRDGGTYEKHLIPYLAARALVAKGREGIQALADVLPRAPGSIYPTAILATLWHASEGKFADSAFGIEEQYPVFTKPIDADTRRAARENFVAFLDECRTNRDSFDRLIGLLYNQSIRSFADQEAGERFHQSVFKVFSDSSLTVSDRLVEGFERLLESGAREEEYQQFLTSNPVFLHPLASRLISKHRLGDDFITDYVLETLSGEYIAVELEKPNDPIFTRGDDFTCEFTHAVGQAVDFIEWIEQNIAYAQKKLPGIAAPRALVIIGRRSALTPHQSNKLRRWNKNSTSIEVLAYDDLLSRTRSLQANIRIRVGLTDDATDGASAPSMEAANSAVSEEAPHTGQEDPLRS